MQILYLLIFVFILVKLPAGTKENSWFKMNVGQTGFYRVNYQIENWQKLVRQLNTSHQVTVIVLLSNLLSGVCYCFHPCSRVFVRFSLQILLNSISKHIHLVTSP